MIEPLRFVFTSAEVAMRFVARALAVEKAAEVAFASMRKRIDGLLEAERQAPEDMKGAYREEVDRVQVEADWNLRASREQASRLRLLAEHVPPGVDVTMNYEEASWFLDTTGESSPDWPS